MYGLLVVYVGVGLALCNPTSLELIYVYIGSFSIVFCNFINESISIMFCEFTTESIILMNSVNSAVWIKQIGQQNLPFGLKFNAKGVLDCYEKDLEILPQGKKRDIDFKMIEGDFQLFEGKWSLEQVR